VLIARGVSKCFGANVALDSVDLQVHAGETVALVGPSGCGKSTLLRCVLGLMKPDRGEIRVGGELLEAGSLRRIRQRIGYVVQGGALFPHLSARDNVTLLGRHLKRSDEELARRVRELCELTRLPEETLRRAPRQLSGGQAQRVSLLRALLLEPEYLLLDEPLGALDPITRYHLQQELKDIFARLRKCVVFVTHDLAEAAFIGSRLVLMRDGRIVQQGSLAQLAETPATPFVTEFIRAHRALPVNVER
jgi:osmoprotectant transport system ATP-binding protein